jgi:hypothetical protein
MELQGSSERSPTDSKLEDRLMTRPVRPARLRERLRSAWLACIVLPTLSAGALAVTSQSPVFLGQVAATFDPVRHETVIKSEVATDSCVMFRLPDEWRLSQGEQGAFSLTAPSGAEISLRLRSAAELKGLPHPDQTGRNAAALQQEYEEVIGKPVQAVSHEETGHPGVTRWSATWIDANLAQPSHSYTIETLIVATGDDSTLEMTFVGNWGPDLVRFEVSRLLPSLRIITGSDCRLRILAAW